MKNLLLLSLIAISCAVVLSCQPRPTGLKDLVKGRYIGAALNYQQVAGQDSIAEGIVSTQFNTITPENQLKWERVHPLPDKYNFGPVDQFVEYGESHNMFMVGHTLVWHQQTPAWVFQDEEGNPATAEVLEQRMRDHIQTVMGKYKGRIQSWDVVNEALEMDGSWRDTEYYRIMGESYVAKAFRIAREADPEAELYYNDYDIWKPEKRDGVVRLVNELEAQGIKVDGIGIQGHWGLDWPDLDELEKSIIAFAKVTDKVMITELDMNILPAAWDHIGADISKNFELSDALNPWPDALPDSMQQKLTDRYRDLFALFQKHSDKVNRITFWGVTDKGSWLNNWPVRGRTAYPLLWDRQGNPKPAYNAVVDVLSEK